jgi:hypothetical protein
MYAVHCKRYENTYMRLINKTQCVLAIKYIAYQLSESNYTTHKPTLFSSELTDGMKPSATSFLDKIQCFCVSFLVICFSLSLTSYIGFPSISCLSTFPAFISLQHFSLRLQLLFNLEVHNEVRNLNTCLKLYSSNTWLSVPVMF